jgi:hypothetical protein
MSFYKRKIERERERAPYVYTYAQKEKYRERMLNLPCLFSGSHWLHSQPPVWPILTTALP